MACKAEDHYTSSELRDMTSLVDVIARKKELEKEEKRLKDKVKSYMALNQHDVLQLPSGDIIAITSSLRKTITKSTKDQFVGELIALGKNYLLLTSIDPDLDSVFAEVDSGQLDKAMVDKYVKVTEVRTLNVK